MADPVRSSEALDDEDDDPNEIELAWIAEARRRLADYEAGRVQAVPGDQVLEKLRRLINRER